MVIDFSQVDLRKRPTLILRNMDETAIGSLSHAIDISMNVHLGEISELTFTYPASVNGVDLPEFDLLTGLRIIDVQGYGQFILRNPEETNDGVSRKKSCTAYSLEYEFNNDTITLEEGTYNFYSPVANSGSIMSLILEKMPHWTVGTVSTSLIGKYRTFQVDSQSIYDFMMNDLQEAYDCIFVFDTYEKTISALSTADSVATNPVYLSSANLIKELQIDENTDDQTTVLDVYGADGVNIRDVNPLGENRLYNLDAYMDTTYFDQSIIDQWNNWKATFATNQQPYFNNVMRMQSAAERLAIMQTELNELNGELVGLESELAVLLQSNAMDPTGTPQSDIDAKNAEITDKNTQISTKKTAIESAESLISDIQGDLQDIIDATSLSAFFTDDELAVLRRYFKVGSLTDSTFVVSNYGSYDSGYNPIAYASDSTAKAITISGGRVTKAIYGAETQTPITFYSIRGGDLGTLTLDDATYSGHIVSGTVQQDTGNTFTMSLYLGDSTDLEEGQTAGTLSLYGTFTGIVPNDRHEEVDGDVVTEYWEGLTITSRQFDGYITQEATEYQKSTVSWELYEYAQQAMEKLAYPTYHFSVQSANFLALDEFYSFAQSFKIGEKIYLHLDDDVIEPVVIGVSMNFDDPSDFTIEFSDSYTTNDKSFTLQSLLDKAVSMGHNLDLQQYNYSSFVNSGAETTVRQFMNSAIDTMKNQIISGDDNEIVIDQSGIRARKMTGGTYDDKQLWISNNAIMLTDDGWQSAKIGIGEFADQTSQSGGTIYGIAAPLLVGKILTGENLIIESGKQDGGVAVFKVDSEGASLHNASFNLYGSTGGRIELGTAVGIVGGADRNTLLHYTDGVMDGVQASDGSNIPNVAAIDSLSSGVTPNANFWLDMNGGAFFKGKILADSGSFGGWTLAENKLYSGNGTSYVALSSATDGRNDVWPNGSSVTTGAYIDDSGATINENGAYYSGMLAVDGGKLYALTYRPNSITATNKYIRIHEYEESSGNYTWTDMIVHDLVPTRSTSAVSLTFTTGQNTTHIAISVQGAGSSPVVNSDNILLYEESETLYAIWAGSNSATTAPFSVKRDGTVTANNGTFGNLEVETVSSGGQTTTTTKIIDGALTVAPASGGRSGGIIYAGSVSNNHHKFEVDENGDVWMTGNLYMPANGSITWASGSAPGAEDVHDLATGQYMPTIGTGETTFISGTTIYSPTIIGNKLVVKRESGTLCGLEFQDQNGDPVASIGAGSDIVGFTGGVGSTAQMNFATTQFTGSIEAGGSLFRGRTKFRSGIDFDVSTGVDTYTTYGSIVTNGTSQGNNRGIQMQYDSTHYVKASEGGAVIYCSGVQLYASRSYAIMQYDANHYIKVASDGVHIKGSIIYD